MKRICAAILVCLVFAAAAAAGQLPAPELYPGEQELYEKALTEGMVVSFDTGPTWANWGALFKAFEKRYEGISLVYNDIGSGATVVALEKARRRPQADTAYYFAQSAIDAKAKGLVESWAPINFEKLPPAFRDSDKQWFICHQLVVAFLVNKKLVKNVPASWADLLKPEYKNSIVYLDPRSTGQGQVLTFGAAYGNGGSVEDPLPGVEYLAKLHRAGNIQRVEGTTPYAKFIKGEIPVWIAYEGDGLKAKLTDGMGDDCAVVIPREASVSAPYAESLVKGGPNPNAGKLWLNFMMSSAGQQLFVEGFVRPSVPDVNIPDGMRRHMPDAPQVVPLDIIKSAKVKTLIDEGWTRLVLGGK
ncbi:MAG: extracellular solute-binding protein [Planctomycetota bacterium]|nr:extracellular solute-binding protein [Planctomycetota bacterium]